MTGSSFEYHEDGSLAVASGAVEVFRLATLASALKLYSTTRILPNRSVNATDLLTLANRATGHHYRRGQYAMAAEGVLEVMRRLKATVPVVGREKDATK